MPLNNPLVSIRCPSYNHEPYLRQALDSILMQKTAFPIEILVGEDCSPDHSREILQEYEIKYPNLFQMFYREENIGGTQNAYDLLMRAKGKYIITLETDDYWVDPYKLQKQVDFLEAHPEYIGCAHTCKVINENGGVLHELWPCHILEPGRTIALQDFLNQGFIFQTATFLHRNIFLDGGDYSIFYKSHPIVGDLTLLSILLLQGDVYILPDCMSVYRRVIKCDGTSAASQSAKNRAKSIEMTMEQLVILEKYFQGRIDYTPMKYAPVDRYLSSWLRREPGFTKVGMKYLWDNAGSQVQKDAIYFILQYPVRKIKKILSKGNYHETK